MKPNTVFNDTIDQIISDGVRRGILHLYTDDDKLHGNQIILKGKKVVNFGSCSYLGLEFDPRLKEASKAAIDNYGTQFSESRAYVSIKLIQGIRRIILSDIRCTTVSLLQPQPWDISPIFPS